jgi:multiple antibiotic resistance protein
MSVELAFNTLICNRQLELSIQAETLGTTEFAVLAISSIIAVMEPFSTIAIYTSLTEGLSVEKQRKIAGKSMKISFLILAFFALTGHLLFTVFNITMYAFEIAGGILLVVVALRMLNPGKDEYSSDERDVSIVPLAIPLTAGPGTITAVMLLFSQASNLFETAFVFIGIFLGVLLSYVGMVYAHRLFKVFGDDGLRVVTALMAIIVLAIAVQFVINGIVDVAPQITGA